MQRVPYLYTFVAHLNSEFCDRKYTENCIDFQNIFPELIAFASWHLLHLTDEDRKQSLSFCKHPAHLQTLQQI